MGFVVEGVNGSDSLIWSVSYPPPVVQARGPSKGLCKAWRNTSSSGRYAHATRLWEPANAAGSDVAKQRFVFYSMWQRVWVGKERRLSVRSCRVWVEKERFSVCSYRLSWFLWFFQCVLGFTAFSLNQTAQSQFLLTLFRISENWDVLHSYCKVMFLEVNVTFIVVCLISEPLISWS